MIFPNKSHLVTRKFILGITFCLLLMLLVSGCRPNVKQIAEMEAAKQRAANAIEGAKAEGVSAEARIAGALEQAKSGETKLAEVVAKGKPTEGIKAEAERVSAEARVEAGKAVEMAAKVKGTQLKDTWSEPLAKAKELLGQAQGKLTDGTKAQEKATRNTVPQVVATYAEAEQLARQSLDQAKIAKAGALEETKRLKETYDKEVADEKLRQEKAARLRQLGDEVKRFQDLLEKAIKSGDPFEIARLMVELAGAELKLEKERLAQGLSTKEAVAQAEKRLADLKDLENRLKQAKADMETAKKKYEEVKAKRETVEKKVEVLKEDIARLRSEINDATQKKTSVEEEVNQQKQ